MDNASHCLICSYPPSSRLFAADGRVCRSSDIIIVARFCSARIARLSKMHADTRSQHGHGCNQIPRNNDKYNRVCRRVASGWFIVLRYYLFICDFNNSRCAVRAHVAIAYRTYCADNTVPRDTLGGRLRAPHTYVNDGLIHVCVASARFGVRRLLVFFFFSFLFSFSLFPFPSPMCRKVRARDSFEKSRTPFSIKPVRADDRFVNEELSNQSDNRRASLVESRFQTHNLQSWGICPGIVHCPKESDSEEDTPYRLVG